MTTATTSTITLNNTPGLSHPVPATASTSPASSSPSPARKRKRVSHSPSSTRNTSPCTLDGEEEEEEDDDDDDGSSTTTTARRGGKGKGGGEMDPVRAARLEARAARNRVSAQHSRDRKKNHVVNLESEVKQLRSDKAEMTDRIKALEDLVKTLLEAGAAAKDVGPLTTTTKAGLESCPPAATLCITPQALCHRVDDSSSPSLAAPTTLPMPPLPASSHPNLPLDAETNCTDPTIDDARLPAAEATMCSDALTQQRASWTLSNQVSKPSSANWEGNRSRRSDWTEWSTAAAEKRAEDRLCSGKGCERKTSSSRGWVMKTAGLHSTSKESSTPRPLRIRVRVRLVRRRKNKGKKKTKGRLAQ